jgi:hypothetical protein
MQAAKQKGKPVKAILLILASAALVGCESSESTKQCAPGQELIDLDGESVCADDVHDVFYGGTTQVHTYTGISTFSGCQTRGNAHCVPANSHSYGYKQGTMSQWGNWCEFKCN